MTEATTKTDEQMNAEIAEALGYTMYHYDKDVPDNCYWCLMNPEGDPFVFDGTWHTGERKTEAEAWADVPDWGEDAALDLVEEMRPLGYVLHLTVWATNEIDIVFGQECDKVRMPYGSTIPQAIQRSAHAALCGGG